MVLPIVGCGDDSGSPGGTTTSSTTGAGAGSGVCILHNCTEDAHCDGCADGKTSCDVDSARCVACGSNGEGCPEGQECSSFGNCVPIGLDCPTDAMGTPQVNCNSSADCAACDPAHLVCDTGTNQCVACTENDTAECQSTDICKDGKCTPACSAACTVDNDCGQCGGAKACNKHKCSECSATYACPSGSYCDLNTGTCEKVCGKVGQPGVCDMDSECAGCQGTTKCGLPINGGPGTCEPPAAGCSDLGNGVLTLPAPYNQVTDLCSNDGDCAGVGITYNVGDALRDLLGTDEIAGQPIDDANIEYPMSTCAAISAGGQSCGVCVPCKVDDDCMDIDIDMLSSDLFPGVGGIIIAFALDQLFGNNDHKLYMYCESVAAGYGVCVPCPGIINDCAPPGGMTGSGECTHAADVEGTALDPACDDCAATVCSFDTYCCETAWDATCVSEAADECGATACHDECNVGAKMGAECGLCAADVCALDSYCCETSWDSTCVSEADTECALGC